MKRIEMDLHRLRPDQIEQAAEVIRRGELVALPTDSTWAIVADPFQHQAVEKLTTVRELTESPRNGAKVGQPLSLLCGSVSQASNFVILEQPQFRLLRRILPGPYTMLLPASRQVPKMLQSKRKSVGIRMPNHPIVQALLETLNQPLTCTTARCKDGALVQSSSEIERDLEGLVTLLLDAEPFVAEPSTVLDYCDETPLVLRAGKGLVDADWELASARPA